MNSGNKVFKNMEELNGLNFVKDEPWEIAASISKHVNSLFSIILNTMKQTPGYIAMLLFDKEENNGHIVINAEDTDVICITINQSSLVGFYLYRKGQVFDC